MAVPEFWSGKVLYPTIAILVGLSALFGLAVMPRLGQSSMVGKPAPELAVDVVNAEGRPRLRSADLRGAPVILDFWSTTCGPCAVQAPILDRIARKYDGKGLIVVGVNVEDGPDAARSYAQRRGLGYMVGVDPTGEVVERFGVEMIPTLVVIDREGKVVAYVRGIVDERALDEMVAAAL
jgi:thiol-disulfide isomerase/thioredoxin